MGSFADKTKENKDRTVVNNLSDIQTKPVSVFQFNDQRPEAVQLRNLQIQANESSQVKQLRAFSALAHNDPQPEQTGCLSRRGVQ